jgi:hypothetical protein
LTDSSSPMDALLPRTVMKARADCPRSTVAPGRGLGFRRVLPASTAIMPDRARKCADSHTGTPSIP